MTTPAKARSPLGRTVVHTDRSPRLSGCLADEGGNVSPIMALLLVPTIGIMALAGEVGYWTMAQRTMQHAADTSALAAAANSDNVVHTGQTQAPYYLEAKAAAAKYPIGNAVVSPSNPDCTGSSAGSKDCWKVELTRTVPFYLARVAGFAGSGNNGQQLYAVAIAKRPPPTAYCAIALGSAGITLEGTSSGWDQCTAYDPGSAKCSGVNNQFKTIFTNDDKTNCKNATQISTPFTDNYGTALKTKIPNKTNAPCDNTDASYNAIPSTSWNVVGDTAFIRVCSTSKAGLLTLSGGPQTLSCPTNNCALILDGVTINLNGNNLTLGGASTIVSTNSSGSTLPIWFKTPNGTSATVSVTAPTDGASATFPNMTFVDDPNIISTQDFNTSNKGIVGSGFQSGKVNFALAGMMYTPNRNLYFDGAIDSSLFSGNCIAFIAKSLNSNGGKLPTGAPTGSCASAGYVVPTSPAIRQALVL